MSIIAAILVLGILITLHEFGHFFFARITGIEVREFSVGFGPQLFSRTGKKGTKYALRLIPLGGYCSFYGEDDVSGASASDPRDFNKQPVWKRLLTILMGPGMNFLLAFTVLVVYFSISGTPIVEAVIQSVEENAPAYVSGIQPGDTVVSVNGADVLSSSDALTQAIAEAGAEPIHMVVRRGGETLALTTSAFFDEALNRYRIGITIMNQQVGTEPIAFGEALRLSGAYCVELSRMILKLLGSLVTTGQGADQMSGVVGAVAQTSQMVTTYGYTVLIDVFCSISVNLGLFNLLPIPGLDGARAIFLIIEGIRRKPVPREKEALVHLIGMGVLFALMIVLVFKDVLTLIGG